MSGSAKEANKTHMAMKRQDPRAHGADRAELCRQLEEPAEITYGVMPLGPEDLALLGKATGYGVNAVKALARIHAEGGIGAVSSATLQEAQRIFGAGMKSLGPQAIKRRLASAVKEFNEAAGRLRERKPLGPQGRVQSEPPVKATAAPKLNEVEQDNAIRGLIKERTELSPKNLIREAGRKTRDAKQPPSGEALRKRTERAWARRDVEIEGKREAEELDEALLKPGKRHRVENIYRRVDTRRPPLGETPEQMKPLLDKLLHVMPGQGETPLARAIKKK
jgi:hypothetical protein